MGPDNRAIADRCSVFLIQMVALVVFQTDNLVVGHFLGAGHIPSYSLTYNRLDIHLLCSQLVLIIFGSRIRMRSCVTISIGSAEHSGSTSHRLWALHLPLSFRLAFIARPFIKLWTGGVVIPPLDLVIWMSAWSMINARCSPIASPLAAAAHMKAQVIYGAISAAINVALSIYLVSIWGITGVIAGTVIS
jgi:O-antigen/teichoic acid export membrane protein